MEIRERNAQISSSNIHSRDESVFFTYAPRSCSLSSSGLLTRAFCASLSFHGSFGTFTGRRFHLDWMLTVPTNTD